LENRISSLQAENQKLQGESLARQRETMAQQRKNECLIRHSDAKQSCDMFFRGEPNSVALHNKIVKCMANKGFAKGAETCGL
jgi:hypothetical protein